MVCGFTMIVYISSLPRVKNKVQVYKTDVLFIMNGIAIFWINIIGNLNLVIAEHAETPAFQIEIEKREEKESTRFTQT